MIEATNISKMSNLSIRLVTLASRFLFVFFVAKLLAPSDLGLYGLVTAAIGYSLYLLGLDFYTYTTRELLNNERREWGGILKNQVALSLILYSLVLPILLLVFTNALLPWYLAKWFFILVVLEHICQEMVRLFIAISEQLFASILLFLRQGSWAIFITLLMTVDEEARNLDAIFYAWVIAALLSVLLGAYRIKNLKLGGWENQIDWSWIVSGMKICVPLLVATLALRGVFTLDKYWLQSLTSLDVVGAYVLFIGVASTLMVFLDAGVFSYSYPALIKAFQTDSPELYRRQMRSMLIQSIFVLMSFSGVSLALLPILLGWIDNPIFTENQSLYPWLLAMMILNALSRIPHYALYAQKIDFPLIQSHLIGFLVFIISTWCLSLYFSSVAIPAGLCITMLFILSWKTLAYLIYTPQLYRGIRI